MSVLAALSTLTWSGWALFAATLAYSLGFVATVTHRSVEARHVDAAALALLWTWLLWLLTPGGA